jgi:hypothetical protein
MKSISIVVNGDSKKKADETFYLDLSGARGAHGAIFGHDGIAELQRALGGTGRDPAT